MAPQFWKQPSRLLQPESPTQALSSAPHAANRHWFSGSQSTGQLLTFSLLSHLKSPHTGLALPQSLLQLVLVSPDSHLPLPQTGLQSVGHVELVSLPSHMKLPQTGPVAWQSLEQDALVSPASHLPLPETGPLLLADGAPHAAKVEPHAA